MATTHERFLWTATEGALVPFVNATVYPPSLSSLNMPPGMVQRAVNVDFADGVVMRPRKGFSTFPSTGTPPAGITWLFSQRAPTPVLWAFTDLATNAYRYTTSGGWSAHALSDTVTNPGKHHAVAYNGKVFLAYDSNVNRLHVYDTAGTIRRVGIGLVAAPTAANGGGAGVAVIRYYKVQQAILSGSTVIASSELSAAVSFTPGANGVTVTKPTTIDSATHWRVFGSADGITYYALNAYTVVATTTLLDNTTPASYNTLTGTVAPIAGLYVPPPSAKFLATDGTRLIMAGAWETSASAGETTPTPRRVWFTRPIGATDAGDDEAITQTADSRYHLDINDPAGGEITGLASTGGLVYVFTAESMWRLVPTGATDTPYRAEQISGSVGAVSQYAVCLGGVDAAGATDDAVYFVSQFAGFYRYTPSRGVEWLGKDYIPAGSVWALSTMQLCYDPSDRNVWIFYYIDDDQSCVLIDTTRLQRRGTEYHGGARRYTTTNPNIVLTCAVTFEGNVVVGGDLAGARSLVYQNRGATDDASASYPVVAEVRSGAIWKPSFHLSAWAPTLYFTTTGSGSGSTWRVIYGADFGSGSASRSAEATITDTQKAATFHGLDISDAAAFYVEIEFLAGTPQHQVELVSVPYRTQEPTE